MDDKKFDSLAKLVGKGSSRRSIFKGLLGLGGAAIAGTSVETGGVDARRVTTAPRVDTPEEPDCPTALEYLCGASTTCCTFEQCNTTTSTCCTGTTLPCGSGCCEPDQCSDTGICCSGASPEVCGDICCPTGTCARSGNDDICCDAGRTPCGLDCCDETLQCCDGECCPDGTVCLVRAFGAEGPFIEEEVCCPTGDACDDQCCTDGECFDPNGGVVPAQELNTNRLCCPSGGTVCEGSEGNLCCEGTTPDCCVRQGVAICINRATQCCVNADCDDDPANCLNGVCRTTTQTCGFSNQDNCEGTDVCCIGGDNECCPIEDECCGPTCCNPGFECCVRTVDGITTRTCINPVTQCCTVADCLEDPFGFDRDCIRCRATDSMCVRRNQGLACNDSECGACDDGNCVDNDPFCTGDCDVCTDLSCVDDQGLCGLECDICYQGQCIDNQADCPGECEDCREGICVDLNAQCSGCEICYQGACIDSDEGCTGCQECYEGDCIDDDTLCPLDCSVCEAGFCVFDCRDVSGLSEPCCVGECSACHLDTGQCVDSDLSCFGDCEICYQGECIDNQADCSGCELCYQGSCIDSDEGCTGCQECYEGQCIDDDTLCPLECSTCYQGQCVFDCRDGDGLSCCTETEDCLVPSGCDAGDGTCIYDRNSALCDETEDCFFAECNEDGTCTYTPTRSLCTATGIDDCLSGTCNVDGSCTYTPDHTACTAGEGDCAEGTCSATGVCSYTDENDNCSGCEVCYQGQCIDSDEGCGGCGECYEGGCIIDTGVGCATCTTCQGDATGFECTPDPTCCNPVCTACEICDPGEPGGFGTCIDDPATRICPNDTTNFCCPNGQDCSDDGDCCPAGTVSCGDECCDSGSICCQGTNGPFDGDCCPDIARCNFTATCCPSVEATCGFSCCTTGEKCCNLVCIDDDAICCTEDADCLDDCLACNTTTGSCVNACAGNQAGEFCCPAAGEPGFVCNAADDCCTNSECGPDCGVCTDGSCFDTGPCDDCETCTDGICGDDCETGDFCCTTGTEPECCTVEECTSEGCCAVGDVCGEECCGVGETCCTAGGVSQCIPDTEGSCCRNNQCPDDAQNCLQGICLRVDGAFAGTCDTRTACRTAPNTQCCPGETEQEAGICVPAGSICCDDPGDCPTPTCDELIREFFVCQGGICVDATTNCDDGVLCTDDLCDPTLGCTNTTNDGRCDNCASCTATGCEFNCNRDAADCCDDEDACTVNTCNANGTCSNALISCDDSDVCTTDTCDPVDGCENTFDCNNGGAVVCCAADQICNAFGDCVDACPTPSESCADAADGCPCTDDENNPIGICVGGDCEVACPGGSRDCIDNPINLDADCCRDIGPGPTCKTGGGSCECVGLGTTIDCSIQPGMNKTCCADGFCGNCERANGEPCGNDGDCINNNCCSSVCVPSDQMCPSSVTTNQFAQTACTPFTCDVLGCGQHDDGCGNLLECEPCCTPRDFCNVGECGKVDDGCKGTLDCGACCTPTTCQQLGCGQTANDCVNAPVYCGDCCSPTFCAQLGCGQTANDCINGEVYCGNCPEPLAETGSCTGDRGRCTMDSQCCEGLCRGRRCGERGTKICTTACSA